jgi:hypothetical protein
LLTARAILVAGGTYEADNNSTVGLFFLVCNYRHKLAGEVLMFKVGDKVGIADIEGWDGEIISVYDFDGTYLVKVFGVEAPSEFAEHELYLLSNKPSECD